MIDLGTLGGRDSYGWAISAAGQVVGYSYTVLPTTDSSPRHGFSWRAQEGLIDLGTLGGTNSFAYAVNGSGQIVGESGTVGEAASHAVLWQVVRVR
jgi:probable HAF family extracellular repeat protein